MWDERELSGVEFIPEPSDSRIVSAADPSTVGHQDGWRGEVLGWSPEPVRVLPRRSRLKNRLVNTGIFAIMIVIIFALYQSQNLIIEIPPKTSEWAFEDTGARDLESQGLTGEGVSVCMVDTGVDITHPDLENVDLTFKDFHRGSEIPVDHGNLAHGTMMAGILVADGHVKGVAPGVRLGMAAALGGDSDGSNSADETLVANAIEWCWKEFDADIISLSLGGEIDPNATRDGPTANAVKQALAQGVYVIAAAGNDGGVDDDGKVATPANVEHVISVAALTEGGKVWSGSSKGSSSNIDGEQRVSPHQKPEISAPGVDIVSTGENGLYYTSTGTSDSTVFVAGVLALILEAEPRLSDNPSLECITEVKDALKLSATPLEDGILHDENWGYGALNGAKWLQKIRSYQVCTSA